MFLYHGNNDLIKLTSACSNLGVRKQCTRYSGWRIESSRPQTYEHDAKKKAAGETNCENKGAFLEGIDRFRGIVAHPLAGLYHSG